MSKTATIVGAGLVGSLWAVYLSNAGYKVKGDYETLVKSELDKICETIMWNISAHQDLLNEKKNQNVMVNDAMFVF